MEELNCNKALKKLRTEILKMSRPQMARAIEIRRQTISEWECDKTANPSLKFKQIVKLDKLLREKGVRFADFDES